MKTASQEKQTIYDDNLAKIDKVLKVVETYLRQKDKNNVYNHPLYIEALTVFRTVFNTCPECGSENHRVENYSMAWHDGDVVCNNCDTYIRAYDAG